MIWLLVIPVWLVLAIIAAPLIGRRLRDPAVGLMDVADATKPPAGRETGPPPAQHCPPGLHVSTALDCILACPACRQVPTGSCTCPQPCGHSYCAAFSSRDMRWLARLKIGDHS